MGQVSVPINGRSFTVICDDGQEPRIRRLAQYVDAKIGQFVGKIGQVGEARLLLLAALAIADELADANDALQQERTRVKATEAGTDDVSGMPRGTEAIAADL